MKITNLHIEKYKHLENLEFDFTYQSGKKKGQPLEKICFIGQSATGKTNLLEFIFNELSSTFKHLKPSKFDPFYNLSPILKEDDSNKFKITFLSKDNHKHIISDNNFESEILSIFKDIEDDLEDFSLFLKSNIISDENINILASNPIELIEKYPGLSDESFENILKRNNTISFDSRENENYWLVIILNILKYRKKFSQKMSELINKGLIADTNRLKREYDKWELENPNPLKKLSEKLNPLLEKLNLEVDYINTEYSIPIKRKLTDETIPIQNTSTGTKGLLLSFLPLFYFREKASMILIDEPERSLYPDMQIDLMDHYRNIAPNSQFIVATHSPFIAAAFEPDERFILYFDSEGNVKVKRGSSPIGDDPNDILYKDFGLETLLNKTGQEIYDDYLKKKQEVLFEENPEKKENLQKEIEKIGDKYDF